MNRPEGAANRFPGRHGVYDLSGLHVSRHALERFAERIAGETNSLITPESVASLLRACRKLGTSETGASAYLSVAADDPFVVIVRQGVVQTVLTLEQFRIEELQAFGRVRWPRRFGRWLRRLKNQSPND